MHKGKFNNRQTSDKQRWGGYFEGLQNPNEDTRDNTFAAQDILEHEPEILRSDVEESLKSEKTGN